MSDTRHVKGLSDLQKLLDTLPAKVEGNVLRGGLRAGANVIRDAARANVRRVSGQLADSLKAGSSARGGKVIARAYTRVFYGRFVEYGTRPHAIAAAVGKALSFAGGAYRSIDHPGAQPRPFLRPALDHQASAAVVAAAEYMRRRLATKHGLDTADIEIEEIDG